MIRYTLLSVLFIFPVFGIPNDIPEDSTTEGPASIRQFRPDSTEDDQALETYFDAAGPLAVEFYEHLTLLSNPWMEGRRPGTAGSDLASQYIIWNLKKSQLNPPFNNGTSWVQPFTIEGSNAPPKVLHAFAAIEDMALVEERDYVVFGNSGSGEVTAPITFVGYAIESGPDGYTSFDKDTDLSGHIALMLRYEPLDTSGGSQWTGTRFSPQSNLRNKMQAVVNRGAVGVILVNPPNCRDGRHGLDIVPSSRMGSTEIPIIQCSEKSADLASLKFDLTELQQLADAGEVTTVDLGQQATLVTELKSSSVQAKNIGGILEGKGDLADEWVVIGGHYDHLGYGYTGTRNQGELHQGADDNASGTSMIMILARMLSEYYQSTDDDSLRSVLFLFFDGEEVGLRGSAHFVKEPIMELDSINAMINLDMVGNLSNNNISISGTGTAEEYKEMIPQILSTTSLLGSLTPSGTGPTDHTNFYAKDIPVLFFFTGITDEYHSPKDQAFRTNPAGAGLIAKLIYSFSTRFVDDPKLSFTANTAGGSGRTSRMPSPVRLGIHPSYSELLETGILIAGVSEGTCAAEAGLQANDILLAWNDKELVGGRSLMDLLKVSKPGDVVIFTVQRDGKNIEIEVTLKAP